MFGTQLAAGIYWQPLNAGKNAVVKSLSAKAGVQQLMWTESQEGHKEQEHAEQNAWAYL